MRGFLARCALFVAVLGLLGGCATAGDDAVDSSGEFTFVSPGGQTRIFYPESQRGRVSGLSGESLLNEGEQIKLSDFKGQVVVLNLWGSWCGPCRSEADDLQAVHEKTQSRGATVLGIDVRDSRTAAADFHRDFGLTYPSIYDPSGRSLLALKNYPRSTVPSTVILDRQHRVAAIFLTELTENELLPEVEKVLAEQH